MIKTKVSNSERIKTEKTKTHPSYDWIECDCFGKSHKIWIKHTIQEFSAGNAFTGFELICVKIAAQGSYQYEQI